MPVPVTVEQGTEILFTEAHGTLPALIEPKNSIEFHCLLALQYELKWRTKCPLGAQHMKIA